MTNFNYKLTMILCAFFLFAQNSSTFSQVIAHWDFNSGTSNVLPDVSGNGHDGVIENGSWETDHLCFNGVNSEVNVESDPSLSGMNQLTVISKVKFNELPEVGEYSRIVGVYDEFNGFNSSTNQAYNLGIDSTVEGIRLIFSVRTGSSTGYDGINLYSLIESFPINEWIEIYALFDNGYMALYVDGELIIEEDFYANANINEADSPLTIGYTIGTNNNNDPLNTHLNGCIDDLKLFNIIVPPGLVAYYPFNANANDESGNGNDGTVNGATLTTDRFGNENSAYNFDGINDFIDCGHNSSQVFSDQLTMIAWVNTASQSNVRFIFSKWGGANDNESFYLALNENNIPYGKINFTDTQEIVPQSSNSIETGNWHMLAMTYNRDSALYYVDGVIVDTIYDNREILSGTLPLMIGDDNGNNLRFSGKIDDCRLYNIALSFSQINSLYDITTNVDFNTLENNNIKLFPNPNNGEFNIKLQNNIENDIYIYSLGGRLIYRNKVKNFCELKLTSLNKGIYILKIISKDRISTEKLIIE
ncbi:MAG: hypothetical protein B6D64_12120 [Bacteroidetes bacterium 4484_276]|nr:MAG: hypothetical protein B6D64_12120 [Bacteroidetes bacterium 4484_276]